MDGLVVSPWGPYRSAGPELRSLMGLPARTAACQEVLEVVSALSGISVDDLLGPSRAQAVSRVRSVAMHLLRTEVGLSAREVGRVLGRSQATVRDLSRLVARGERAGDLAARVRAELNARHAGRPQELGIGRRRWPLPDLAARRRAAGLQQAELAAKASIARETLSRIEHGRPAHPDIIERLAAALEGTPLRPNATRRYSLPGLEAWRTRAGVSQHKLAARIGIARETLSRIERGRVVGWKLVESLAAALLVMPSMLTSNPEDDPADQPARRCTECHALRPIHAFVPIRRSRAGHYGRCRACRNARARARYWSNPDILEAERERARRNKRLQKGRPAAASAAYAAARIGGGLSDEPEDERHSRGARSTSETPSVVPARDAGSP